MNDELLVQLMQAGADKNGESVSEVDFRELIASCRSGANVQHKLSKQFDRKPVIRKLRLRELPPHEGAVDTNWLSKEQERNSRIDVRDLERLTPNMLKQCYPYVKHLPVRLASNLLIAELAHTGGDGLFIRSCDALGLLSDRDNFIAEGKELSNLAKLRLLRFSHPDVRRDWFIEIQELAGVFYPSKDDETSASDKLRETADVDNTPAEPMRSLYLQSCLAQRFDMAREIRSLEEYVASLDWKTDGSASMAGLQSIGASIDGESFTVRVTKSLVPYVTTNEALLTAVKAVRGISSVIVKTVIKQGERGDKARLIYPYPLAVAIAKMYVLEGVGGGGNYPANGVSKSELKWSTSLGQSGYHEVLRHLRTLALVSPDAAQKVLDTNAYLITLLAFAGAPFDMHELHKSGVRVTIAADADGFDTQVGRFFSDEYWDGQKSVVGDVIASTLPHVMPTEFILPIDKSDKYLKIPRRRELEASCSFDTLVAQVLSDLVENKALLLSGTPETSKLGTRCSWNTCDIGAGCLNYLWAGCMQMYDSRGDDMLTCIRGVSRAHALNLATAFWYITSSFLRFSAKKSRVSAGIGAHTEFLRVDYSSDGVAGYVNRALVWVGEVRPLSSEDTGIWASRNVAGIDRALTAARRGARWEVVDLCISAAVVALAKLGISFKYLHAPTLNGGAGLLQPSAAVFAHGNSRRFDIDAEVNYDWSARKVESDLGSLVTLTPGESYSLARERFQQTVLKAAPLSVQRAASTRPRYTGSGKSVEIIEFSLDHAANQVSSIASFNRDPTFESRFSRLNEVARHRRVSVWSLLSEYERNQLRAVEKRYKFPRSVAVSWLSGKMPSNVTWMHPELTMMRDMILAPLFAASHRKYRYDAHNVVLAICALSYELSTRLQRSLSMLYAF